MRRLLAPEGLPAAASLAAIESVLQRASRILYPHSFLPNSVNIIMIIEIGSAPAVLIFDRGNW